MNKNSKILVVEDMLSARETVLHLLKALGFSSFVEADSGVSALECLERYQVDLIISDWNMPKMNGLVFLKKIRALEDYASTPFIFVTSKSEVEDIALASDFGVSGYLIKPITIRILDECLKKVFSECFSFEEELNQVKEIFANQDKILDSSKADQVFKALALKYPAHGSRIFLELAQIFMRAKEFEQAESLLCEILAAKPLFSKGWEMMSRLQSWLGKWPEALATIEKSLEISPNNSDYHVLKGSIYLHMENLYGAQKSFMTALNIDRKNDQIKQDIWNIYLDLDMIDEVQRDFGAYIFSALTCDTLNNMAVAYRRRGELTRALEVYRIALTREPDNPKILFNTAVAYVNRKQYAKARALLQHALKNDPTFQQASSLLLQIDNTLSDHHELEDRQI